MNYRIEKRDAIRVLGKKIALKPTLGENFQITPVFWQQSSMDGTVETLAGRMDTDLFGLDGCQYLVRQPCFRRCGKPAQGEKHEKQD